MPSESGSVSGKPPLPISVVVTGMRAFRANAVSSAAALLLRTPPPAYTMGRDAPLNRAAAAAIWLGLGTAGGTFPVRSVTCSGNSNSVSVWAMSRGMSTSTGPGRPMPAMRKLWSTMRGRSCGVCTSQLCLVMDVVRPITSAS